MPNLPSITLGKRKKNVKNQPKIKKVVHPGGGYTLVALPGSKIGDTEIIDGEVCTIVSGKSLRKLITPGHLQEAVTRTCTSYITDMSELCAGITIKKDWEFHFDTRRVTNMMNMFMWSKFEGDATSPNVRSLRHWDTSNVVHMTGMFRFSDFNSPSIASWNTRNTRSMKNMFRGNSKFNQSISGWDTRNVETMEEMFFMTTFNQAIDRWDTSRVKTFNGMFEVSMFNRPLNSWNVSSATYMKNMFHQATRFNRPLNRWDVSNVVTMEGMFDGASSFNQDLSMWNPKRIKTAKGMFKYARSYSPKNPTDAFHSRIGFEPRTTKLKLPKQKKGKTRSDIITQWTTSEGYLAVQAARRQNNTETNFRNPDTAKKALQVNRAISQHMRNGGLKTPTTPAGMRPRYLYRGIHSGSAARLLTTGRLVDPGFIAFSRSKSQAESFSRDGEGVLVRINVDALPRGIPWLWFSTNTNASNSNNNNNPVGRYRTPRRFPMSNAPYEQEVLLPPGKLVLGKKIGTYMYEATYLPNTRAKSLEQKPIIRRIGPPRLDSKTRQTQMEKHLDQMFREVLSF